MFLHAEQLKLTGCSNTTFAERSSYQTLLACPGSAHEPKQVHRRWQGTDVVVVVAAALLLLLLLLLPLWLIFAPVPLLPTMLALG